MPTELMEAPAEVSAEPIESTEGAEQSEVEQPEGVETPDTDGIESPDGEEDGEATEEVETPEEVAAQDGRRMPDAIKKGLAALKAENPAAAKELKGIYYANQDYRAAFSTPVEAKEARALIEEVGGTEGIAAIHEERQEWSQLDEMYAKGDKDFVKAIAENNPEAFQKTAAHVINEFAARAPEQYQYYANNVAVNTLASSGISIDALASAYQRYADNPQAQAIIADVHNALVGIKEKTQQFEQKRTDPREEQLKQKETQFEERRRADFEGGIADKFSGYFGEKVMPEIDRVLAGRKIDPSGLETIKGLIKADVERRMDASPNFTNQLEALYRTGNSAKALEYITGLANRFMPEAVKTVVAPLYRNVAAAPANKTVGTKTASTGTGEVFLKEMPSWDQVDRTKTTTADMMMGKAVLTNGKRASGWA